MGSNENKNFGSFSADFRFLAKNPSARLVLITAKLPESSFAVFSRL